MAFKKVKTFKVSDENETGEKYSASLAMQIDVDTGRFRIEVPEDLAQIVKVSGAKMYFPKHNEKYIYAFSDSLKGCEKIIRDAISEHLACKIELEIIIAYQFFNRTHYYKTHEGNIEINGRNDDNYHDDNKRGTWYGGEGVGSFDDVEGLGLNLMIEVFERQKFVRPSSTSAKYVHYCHRSSLNEDGTPNINPRIHAEHWHNSDIAEKLAEVKMNGTQIRDLNSYHKRDITNTTGDIKIIPFTEESGQFFLNMCFGMFKLADRFTEFFSHDEEEIQKIMKSNIKLLE